MAWNDLLPSDPALRRPHEIYLVLGAFIATFGLISLVIKDRLYMSEAMVAVMIGIVVGPVASKVLDPSQFGLDLNNITLEFTRLIVGIQCMACGVDLPGNYMWKEWKSLVVLLGPVMLVKWLVTAAGIFWIMEISFLDALVISACITPTDPVLANSIVKGKFAEKHVPLNVRLILSAESGANDGLGTPFLLLAIYLIRLPVGQAIGEWSYKVVLYQVILSVILGGALALLAKICLKTAEYRDWIDKESIFSFSIALALLIMGIVSLLGSDDIFAVFVAGNVLTWDLWFNQKVSQSNFQEVIDALLNLAYFVYIGAIIPWSAFVSGNDNLELWRLFLVALWILILRRLPIVMLLQRWIPVLKDSREAFFAGWFGPIGAGAIFYAHVAVIYFEYPASPIIPVIFFIVLMSIVVHGGSVALFNMSLNRTTTFTQWDAVRRVIGNAGGGNVGGGVGINLGNIIIPGFKNDTNVDNCQVDEIPGDNGGGPSIADVPQADKVVSFLIASDRFENEARSDEVGIDTRLYDDQEECKLGNLENLEHLGNLDENNASINNFGASSR